MTGATNQKHLSTVRRRAIHFLRTIDVRELPLETAKELFSQVNDLWDRTTIKAYFGTHKHVSRQNIRRVARYGTGTYSFKVIELVRDVETKKGYLEKLGLVHYELRGKTWFMVLNKDAVLVPQLYERNQLSIENISLSPYALQDSLSFGERVGGKTAREVPPHLETAENKLETNNNLQDEREKSGHNPIFNKSELGSPKECKGAS